MLEAAGWGLLGASSLLIGAVIGLAFRLPHWLIGLVLGFGAGTLISALTFELTDEAYRVGGADAVAIGLALGALTYYGGNQLTQRRGGAGRMSPRGRAGAPASSGLLLGAILDGIPESAVIGISLLEGGGVSLAVLLAVFLSNLPESISSSTGMVQSGVSRRHVLTVWLWVVLVSGLAAAVGYGVLDGASGNAIGGLQAFAAGAVLTMLVDTMIPEALREGGPKVGLVTVLGFALAFLLSTLE
jgi:zinc transporter, ZIP family